jgi:hypothetical protein
MLIEDVPLPLLLIQERRDHLFDSFGTNPCGVRTFYFTGAFQRLHGRRELPERARSDRGARRKVTGYGHQKHA